MRCYWAGVQSVGSCCVAWFVSASGPVNPAAVRSTEYPRVLPALSLFLWQLRVSSKLCRGCFLRDGRPWRLGGKKAEKGESRSEKRERKAGPCWDVQWEAGTGNERRAQCHCWCMGAVAFRVEADPTPVEVDHSARRLLRCTVCESAGPARCDMAWLSHPAGPSEPQQIPGGWAAGPVTGWRLAHTAAHCSRPSGKGNETGGAAQCRIATLASSPGLMPFLRHTKGLLDRFLLVRWFAVPIILIQGSGSAAGLLPVWAHQAMPNRGSRANGRWI